MDTKFVVDGVTYEAFNEGDFNGTTTWMVKRYQQPTGGDDESNYVECLLSVATKDPHEAIKTAIAVNSWA